jgi:hypothetical protein
MQDEHNQDME